MNRYVCFMLNFSFFCSLGHAYGVGTQTKTVSVIAQALPSVESIYVFGNLLWKSFQNSEKIEEQIKERQEKIDNTVKRIESYEEILKRKKERIEELKKKISESSYLVQFTTENSVEAMENELRELQESLHKIEIAPYEENVVLFQQSTERVGTQVVPGQIVAPGSQPEVQEDAQREQECSQAIREFRADKTNTQKRETVEQFASEGWFSAKRVILRTDRKELERRIGIICGKIRGTQGQLEVQNVFSLKQKLSQLNDWLIDIEHEISEANHHLKSGKKKAAEFRFDSTDDVQGVAVHVEPAQFRPYQIIDGWVERITASRDRLLRTDVNSQGAVVYRDALIASLQQEIDKLGALKAFLRNPNHTHEEKTSAWNEAGLEDGENVFDPTHGFLKLIEQHDLIPTTVEVFEEMRSVRAAAVRTIRKFVDSDHWCKLYVLIATIFVKQHDRLVNDVVVEGLLQDARLMDRILNEATASLRKAAKYADEPEKYDEINDLENSIENSRTRAILAFLNVDIRNSISNELIDEFVDFGRRLRINLRPGLDDIDRYVQQLEEEPAFRWLDSAHRYILDPTYGEGGQWYWLHENRRFFVRLHKQRETGKWQWTLSMLRNEITEGTNFISRVKSAFENQEQEIVKYMDDGHVRRALPRNMNGRRSRNIPFGWNPDLLPAQLTDERLATMREAMNAGHHDLDLDLDLNFGQ